MKYKILLLFSILILTITLQAQYTMQTLEKGYKISITVTGIEGKKAYLKGTFGDMFYLLDSAKINNKGKFTFQSKDQALPSGIYLVITDQGKQLFEILIDNSRYFTIETQIENILNYITIEGSEENKIFFEYQKAIITESDLSQFVNTSPQSLLSKYIQALYSDPKNLPDILLDNDSVRDSFRQKYEFYVFHYYDDIDFSDIRLPNTPLHIDLESYFTEILKHQEPQFINQAADNILSKAKGKTEETNPAEQYYLHQILQIMLRGGEEFDASFVYLYDKYYKNNNHPTNYESRIYQQFANVKRRLLPGATVPEMCAYMTEDSIFCSHNISNSYIIVWLWDPDCDDCAELTPKLFEFYQQFHESFDFEVFAVSVTPDFDRWQKFSKAHALSWINLSYSLGDPNYDFVEFFDVLTTPVIYLLDKNHKIINRHFSLDELYGIISNLNPIEN